MNSRLLAVLGGSCLDAERMAQFAESAHIIVAVDAGYRNCISSNFLPQIIAGDFDSVELNAVSEEVEHVPLLDQEHTDTAKLLAWCKEWGYRRIHLICVEGGLPDHQLQIYFSAAASGLDVWFIFQRGLGRIITPRLGRIGISTSLGTRVSLLPLTPCQGVTLVGTRWSLNSESLSPTGRSSISNAAEAELVECSIQRGKALLFWETNDVIWE
jgi:thiamine pyrophosphokinase